MDSLDLELLTNEEMQSLKDVEDLADGLLFPASDTTVTAEVGKIVYKSSDANMVRMRESDANHKMGAI
jgi:hypothetical protein